MKKLILLSLALTAWGVGMAQDKYFTRDGHIRFFSTTPIEDIEAHNRKVTAIMTTSGQLEFSALMKSFEFEKALMEEHFNENYAESNTYPKATFKGNIKGFDLKAIGSETHVTAVGSLTIHGVTNEVEVPGTLSKTATGYAIKSTFKVKPEDYKIEIPNAVRDNIAKDVEVTVDVDLKPLTK